MDDHVKITMKWVQGHLDYYYLAGKGSNELIETIKALRLDDDDVTSEEEKKIQECYDQWTDLFQNNPIYAIWGVYFSKSPIIGSTMDCYFVDYGSNGEKLYLPMGEVSAEGLEVAAFFTVCEKNFKDMVEHYRIKYQENKEKGEWYKKKLIEYKIYLTMILILCAAVGSRSGNIKAFMNQCSDVLFLLITFSGIVANVIITKAVLCLLDRMAKVLKASRQFEEMEKLLSSSDEVLDIFREKQSDYLKCRKEKWLGYKFWKKYLYTRKKNICTKRRSWCDIEELAGNIVKYEEASIKKWSISNQKKWLRVVFAVIIALILCIWVPGYEIITKFVQLGLEKISTNSTGDAETDSEQSEETDHMTEPQSNEGIISPGEPQNDGSLVSTPIGNLQIKQCTIADQVNVRGDGSDRNAPIDELEPGQYIEVVEWNGDAQKSMWANIFYKKGGQERFGWVNRKTIAVEYEDEIPVRCCRSGWGKDLDALCDDYLQSTVSFEVSDINSMGDIVLELEQSSLIKYIGIYSGNYMEDQYDDCGMVSEVKIKIQEDGKDGRKYEVQQKLERRYDVTGFWIPIEGGIIADRVLIEIMETEGSAPAYLSEITLMGEASPGSF